MHPCPRAHAPPPPPPPPPLAPPPPHLRVLPEDVGDRRLVYLHMHMHMHISRGRQAARARMHAYACSGCYYCYYYCYYYYCYYCYYYYYYYYYCYYCYYWGPQEPATSPYKLLRHPPPLTSCCYLPLQAAATPRPGCCSLRISSHLPSVQTSSGSMAVPTATRCSPCCAGSSSTFPSGTPRCARAGRGTLRSLGAAAWVELP